MSVITINKKIPLMFQKIDEYKIEDSRFLKVKIWLMHLEENLNGTYFSEETVTEALPSLANTPILGYIEEREEDDVDDFSDHRAELERDDEGDWKFSYKGRAYGVIPETNNAKFEYRVCDDGIERKFVTVEGLIWTKWDEPLDILKRDEVKPHSMELHDDIEGFFNKTDNLFHITKFKFFGACILGDHVAPAMRNSTVELDFTAKNLQDEINKEVERFKLFEKNMKGEENEKMNKNEILKKYSMTQEEVEELGIKFEELNEEELENALSEHKEKEKETPEDTDGEENDSTELKEFSKTFSLSFEDIRSKIYSDYLNGKEDGGWCWIVETFEDKFIYQNGSDNRFFKADYNITDDKVVVTNEIEVFSEFLTKEEKENLDSAKSDYENLQTKVKELQDEVDKYNEAKKEEETEKLFAENSELEGIEAFDELKENSNNYSIQDLEKEIGLIFMKNKNKLNFSQVDKEKNEYEFDKTNKEKNVDSRYGTLFELLEEKNKEE